MTLTAQIIVALCVLGGIVGATILLINLGRHKGNVKAALKDMTDGDVARDVAADKAEKRKRDREIIAMQERIRNSAQNKMKKKDR